VKGLYVNAGHSFGNSSGPISGELMASLVAGEADAGRVAAFRLDRPALNRGTGDAVNW
jgi:glycine/D-amino acid oxidase-like deaminating enzyme